MTTTAISITGSRQTATTPAKTGAQQLLERLSVEKWVPGEPLPATLAKQDLQDGLRQVGLALAPCDEASFGSAMDKLLAFGAAFKIPTGDLEETVALYGTALAHLPGDVLLNVVNQAIGTWRWGNRLPMPADLLAMAPAFYTIRLQAQRTLTSAMAQWVRANDAREAKLTWYRSWRQDYYAAHGKTPEDDGVEWPGPGHRYTPLKDGTVPSAHIPDRNRGFRTSVQNALHDLKQNMNEDPEVHAAVVAETGQIPGGKAARPPLKTGTGTAHA